MTINFFKHLCVRYKRSEFIQKSISQGLQSNMAILKKFGFNPKDLRYIADVKPDSADKFTEEFGDRVLFTPKKMGAQTAEANINAGIAAANQVVAFLKDGWNKYQVNK